MREKELERLTTLMIKAGITDAEVVGLINIKDIAQRNSYIRKIATKKGIRANEISHAILADSRLIFSLE